ncbi:ZrgA family zinc uptake protein [Maritimibacter dapengensis]|uniref:ZrgA family zinc uptake protein n=1 Tax=Maritimibacter dapengensis TaxID=2836868 RepID=UPI0021079264|nr:DUF2796 domain-containing protein [Maritimibacter dapengensis]
MKHFITTALATIVLASTPVRAKDEHREIDTHIHSVSTLELTIDNSAINPLSPGMDVVGFEKEASFDADKDSFEAAIRAMLTPENRDPAGGCRVPPDQGSGPHAWPQARRRRYGRVRRS